MYTPAELALLRQAAPGAVIPGIDTKTGATSAPTIKASSIPSNPTAPYFYDPVYNRIIVKQAGVVLSGIDFGDTTLTIMADNVTVKNCTFEPTTQVYSITTGATSGAVVQNCTFTGPTTSTRLESFIASGLPITIKDNSFIDSPSDAIHVNAGTITGNYFSGSGYENGAHADAIWVSGTNAPVTITNNFIDETPSANASTGANSAVRITTESGNTTNVTITDNYMLGGNYPVEVGLGANGVFTNVNVSNNYVGFGLYGNFYPGNITGVTETGNVVFDFRNAAYSTTAWAAYAAQPSPTARTITSTGLGIVNDSATVATTLYGAGNSQIRMTGNNSFTNFVGGYGRQGLSLGLGANIVTELSVSDSSWESGTDYVGAFDPGKDVVDLSHIDADLTTPGTQNFTYIGNADFSGTGAQVRWYQDPTAGITYVDAKLAGDTSADLSIVFYGMPTLSAANFALTAAQSATDIAADRKSTRL